MEKPVPEVVQRDGLSNIFKNLGWLLGGKGFAAVCSIVYLAVLSRSLGLRDFGHFSLIFGTGQALVAIASFQTWQTLVRFGASSVVSHDWARFGRLAWLCGALDVSGAVVGTFIAWIVYYGFGDALDLNPDYINMAFAFNCALLWSRMTTPNGIVRVLDRFDIGSYVEAVIPVGRLIASFIILATGASVGRFLLAWAVLELLSAAIYWIVAWRLVPRALHHGNFGHWDRTIEENPGIIRFFGITYGNATLDALYKQGPLLAVGYFLGTSAAGLYRLADQIAQSIGKFATLITRAVFPEFVHAQMGTDAWSFRKLVRQVTLIAGAGGVLVTLAAIFFGRTLLELIGGSAFGGGAEVLVPLAIAASFELASVSYEPTLLATGHANYPLIVRAISLAVMLAGIFLLWSYGPEGIGWAVMIGMVVCYVLMSFAVRLVMRQMTAASAQ